MEEDQSALPKKDSRLLLAKFNEQLEPLFVLLQQVEGIKLAPELLEPEPVDISAIKGVDKKSNQSLRPATEQWSGEATRNTGFQVEETRVDVTISEDTMQNVTARKERPVWMVQSTIMNQDSLDNKVYKCFNFRGFEISVHFPNLICLIINEEVDREFTLHHTIYRFTFHA